MLIMIFIVALVGISISAYLYQLEQKIAVEPDFKPACDISDRVSCSKPIKSGYSKLIGVSNSALGIVFYLMVALLAIADAGRLLFLASVAACCVSIFLAFILYFKIESVCILCTALYIINIILLGLSFPFAQYLYV